jgi:hypothetical protein
MKRVKEDRLGMQRIDVDCARRAGLTIEILFQWKWKAQILCAMRYGPIRLVIHLPLSRTAAGQPRSPPAAFAAAPPAGGRR